MQTNLNNVVLVGPMGSGKTTVGRRLSEKLGIDFYDADNEVIKKTGVSILMVEQNASKALKAADFGYVIELGNLQTSGSSISLLNDKDIKKYYLGL